MVRPSSRPRADASSLIARVARPPAPQGRGHRGRALLVGLLALALAVGFLLGYLGAALLGLPHA
jgi:hypothetical protein